MESIKKSYNNNKFKTSAPAWNEEFDLPDGSYSRSYIRYSRLFLIYNICTIIYNIWRGKGFNC